MAIGMEDKKVTTKRFRVSFPALFKAKAMKGSEPKFSVVMLFSKKDDSVKDLVRAANAAASERWGAKAPEVLKKIKGTKNYPIHDGDVEKTDMKGYKGHYFVSAKAKEGNPPGVVDEKRRVITDEKEVYAGCYGRATVIAYAYDNDFGKGVGFSLQNFQKWGEGEKFTSKKDATEEFDDLDVEDLEAIEATDEEALEGLEAEEDTLGF